MKSTADRYREAGMPPPKGEPALAAGGTYAKPDTTNPPLAERVHDPALDGWVLPEIDPATYGPASVPLDTPDAETTEEQS